MMILLLDGEIVSNRQFRTKDGTSYSCDWLINSSRDDRDRIGIIEMEEVYNPLPDGFCYSSTYIDEGNKRIYDIIPLPDGMKIS